MDPSSVERKSRQACSPTAATASGAGSLGGSPEGGGRDLGDLTDARGAGAIVNASGGSRSAAVSSSSRPSSCRAPRLSPPVEEVLQSWRPARLDPEDQAVVGRVLPHVRVWVAAAAPPTANEARRLLWPTLRLAAWAYRTVGSTDPEIVLHPHNIEHWANHAQQHRPNRWRCKARSLVRRVSRAVNPAAWQPATLALERAMVSQPYLAQDEALFSLDALLPGRRHRAARIWVVCAAFGAGMRGPEIRAGAPEDLLELPGGRVGVRVRGAHSRLVPVRAAYTDMIKEAARTAPGRVFIASQGQDPVQSIAKRIGPQGLALRRARSTWLAAHVAANTPLAALRTIAGQLSVSTLNELVEQARVGLTDQQAAEQGLGA